MKKEERYTSLSPLEQQLMRVIWERGPSTVEDVRTAMDPARELKDSTIRTLLRRIEEKGFLKHRTAGRAYVYEPGVPPEQAAARAARQIIDRVLGGSAEALLLGMVNHEVLDVDDLKRLVDKLDRERGEE